MFFACSLSSFHVIGCSLETSHFCVHSSPIKKQRGTSQDRNTSWQRTFVWMEPYKTAEPDRNLFLISKATLNTLRMCFHFFSLLDWLFCLCYHSNYSASFAFTAYFSFMWGNVSNPLVYWCPKYHRQLSLSREYLIVFVLQEWWPADQNIRSPESITTEQRHDN